MRQNKINENLEAIISRAPKDREFKILIFLSEPESLKNSERQCYADDEEGRRNEMERIRKEYQPIKDEASKYFETQKMKYEFDDQKPSFVYLELTKSQVYQIAKQDFVRQVLAKPHRAI